jgi:hypothetical protein
LRRNTHLSKNHIYYASDIENHKKAKGRITEAIDRRAALRSAFYVPIVNGRESVAVLVIYSPLSAIWGQAFGPIDDHEIRPADLTFYNCMTGRDVQHGTIKMADAITSATYCNSNKLIDMACYFSKEIGRIIYENTEILTEIEKYGRLRQIIDNLSEFLEFCMKNENEHISIKLHEQLKKIRSIIMSSGNNLEPGAQSVILSRELKNEVETLALKLPILETKVNILISSLEKGL